MRKNDTTKPAPMTRQHLSTILRNTSRPYATGHGHWQTLEEKLELFSLKPDQLDQKPAATCASPA